MDATCGIPELSERASKETVSTKHENNCPQLLVGLLFSDCSCGELLLNSILYVSLKAFQRGSEKAGCTLVNWKLFVTNHPSPSLNIHHQKEVGPQGRRPDPGQGEPFTFPVAPVFLGDPGIIYALLCPDQWDFRRRRKKERWRSSRHLCFPYTCFSRIVSTCEVKIESPFLERSFINTNYGDAAFTLIPTHYNCLQAGDIC